MSRVEVTVPARPLGTVLTPVPCSHCLCVSSQSCAVTGSQALGVVARGLCPMVPTPLIEACYPRDLPPHPQRFLALCCHGPGSTTVKEVDHALPLLPSSLCLALSPPASWTAIEHSLLKLGEILANLSNPQLRSQAERCGTLIRRLGFCRKWEDGWAVQSVFPLTLQPPTPSPCISPQHPYHAVRALRAATQDWLPHHPRAHLA